MKSFKIKAGSGLPVLRATLLAEGGKPQALNGAEVRIGVRRRGNRVLLISRLITIVDEAAEEGDELLGVVECEFTPEETATILGPGDFEYDFRVQLANGKVGGFPTDPEDHLDMVVEVPIAQAES